MTTISAGAGPSTTGGLRPSPPTSLRSSRPRRGEKVAHGFLVIAAGVLIAFAVGVGRVVLNVHHPSDVVAGWALGWVWFVATLPLLPAYRARVRAEAGTPAARDSGP